MASFFKKLEVKDDAYNSVQTSIWYNADIAPFPPIRRTWGYVDYFGFTAVAR